ncbi:MAG: hypothetical protein ABJA64_03165 [Candidatus Saccharibacteria bacterium]
MVKKHLHISKKKMILVISGLLLVGLASGLYVLYSSQPSAAPSTAQKPKTTEQKIAELVETDDSSKLASSETALKKLADNESNKVDKAKYLSGAAQAAMSASNPKTALDYATQAEAANPSAETAADIGAYASESGDFALSAKYFGIAADRSGKTNDPTERTPYNDYMALKREAEVQIK